MPELITYAEAAKRLAVSRSTLMRMIRAGRLVPVYVSARTPRLKVEDVERVSGGAS